MHHERQMEQSKDLLLPRRKYLIELGGNLNWNCLDLILLPTFWVLEGGITYSFGRERNGVEDLFLSSRIEYLTF
jgi:hypothetical protein